MIKTITAKKTWKIRQEAMWPDKPLSFVQLPEDEKMLHFGFFSDDELLSVVSMLDLGSGVGKIRKLATLPIAQGYGYASELMKTVFIFCKEQEFKIITCDVRVEKVGFYKNLGMTIEGKAFEKYDKAFVKMLINL